MNARIPSVVAVTSWGVLALYVLSYILDAYEQVGAFDGSGGGGGGTTGLPLFPKKVKGPKGTQPPHPKGAPVPKAHPHPAPAHRRFPFLPPILPGFRFPKKRRVPRGFKPWPARPGFYLGPHGAWWDPNTGVTHAPGTAPPGGFPGGSGGGGGTSIPNPGRSPVPGLPALPPEIALP